MTTVDVRMDETECVELLERKRTGVISFATGTGEPPHSLPVSFGYDTVESTFYFRIADTRESEKGELHDRQATFVVYDHSGERERYRSVVAQGTLEETTDDEIATETLDGLERVSIPFVDIFGEPPSEVDFEFYRLVADRLTGRKESPTEL